MTRLLTLLLRKLLLEKLTVEFIPTIPVWTGLSLCSEFLAVFDAELTAGELQETITEVSTKKTANGYYFGELGITLFGSDEKGYELMLKN